MLYTLRIPCRLAYEWYQSSNCNYVMMLNESVEWLGLNEKTGALQERIRSKVLTQCGSLLQSKKGVAESAAPSHLASSLGQSRYCLVNLVQQRLE